MSVGGLFPSSSLPDPSLPDSAAAPGFEAAPVGPLPLGDAAIAAAFRPGFDGQVGAGSRGDQVVAVQYALGRLGYDVGTADGSFGRRTGDAVAAFQTATGIAPSGVVDRQTLYDLDRAVAGLDLRTGAERAADPMAYLSDFAARGVSPVEIHDRSQPIAWAHPEVQQAYGRFTAEYWEVMKENRVEADCKTVALLFMDQFRRKLHEDTGVLLPLPSSGSARVIDARWTAATSDRTQGFFSRFERLRRVRPGYQGGRNIQRLDRGHSMIYGVNLRRSGMDANAVSRAATTTWSWDPALDNRGDRTRPELPVSDLRLGDMIFIDHTGNGTYDHTVNVVGIERDPSGGVSALRLAVGSFDHMLDADSSTSPAGLQEVNNYAEEVTVSLDGSGRVTDSRVTWRSEPDYVSPERYSAATTLMELQRGGRLKIARWGGR